MQADMFPDERRRAYRDWGTQAILESLLAKAVLMERAPSPHRHRVLLFEEARAVVDEIAEAVEAEHGDVGAKEWQAHFVVGVVRWCAGHLG